MRIRQIVFAAQDLRRGSGLLASLLELPPPFQDPGVAEFGIDNAVFSFGDQFIEVISPVRADTACGRHLARHGDGGYMLILQTDSLARERARFAALGVRSVWQIELEDISAMHLHPKDVGGAIVSVDEPRPAASWRWGGPQWRVQPGPSGQQCVRGITLQAVDPAALAQRWAQVLGQPAPVAMEGCWRLALTAGFADFVAAPAGAADGVAGFTLAVVQPEAVLAAARGAGLAVDGMQLEVLGTRWTLEPV
ncbi:MAG: VOC family protein [Ideonella sp.]|nr:VOC family protein [Ideonella sp.]MBL0150275.1 VOC family protein [Ideonella sp.]